MTYGVIAKTSGCYGAAGSTMEVLVNLANRTCKGFFFLHNKKPLLTNNKKNNNKSPSLCPSLSYSLAFEMHFPISYLLRQMMLSEVRWGVIISTQSGPIHWYLKWFANMASPHYIVITGGSNYCPRACTWQMQGSILSFLYSRFHTDMT